MFSQRNKKNICLIIPCLELCVLCAVVGGFSEYVFVIICLYLAANILLHIIYINCVTIQNIPHFSYYMVTRAVGGQRARLLGTFYIVTFLSLSHII